MPSVVIILGAGATLSDVSTASLSKRPPLDRGFFAVAQKLHSTTATVVSNYMRNTYQVDITAPGEDFLERVMAAIYTDLYNPALEADALVAFRALLRLFTQRLTQTTNAIAATQKRFLYRIMVLLLTKGGCKPEDITIVTFNQDLQAEKVLSHLAAQGRWIRAGYADRLWRFPYAYRLGTPAPNITRPTSAETFSTATSDGDCVAVLKLHGSLNWYSSHTSPEPTRAAMFRTTREIRITARVKSSPSLTLTGKKKTYGLPVIVPPVSHKSSVLHQRLQPVWELAEERLKSADEIIVFGYSCPPLDFESANLLRRSQRDETPARRISIIDPNPAVVSRYMELMTPCRLRYYPKADYYLTD